MKKQRLSIDEWQGILLDDSGGEDVSVSQSDADELSHILDQVEQATDTRLSQQDQDRIFERSWKWSAPPEREPIDWFGWVQPLVLKPTFIFVFGMLAGVWLTLQYQSGGLDIAQEVQAEEPLVIEESIYQRIFKGPAVNEVYSDVENPYILEIKSRDGKEAVSRVLYGTISDGEVVVIENLDQFEKIQTFNQKGVAQ